MSKENLYVFTIDEENTFGIYEEEDLEEAMIELFRNVKHEVDLNHSVEEQIDFHLPYLYQLQSQIKACKEKRTVITLEDINKFLNIFNNLKNKDYDVEVIEVELCDCANVIGYINDYGLKNYKNNFVEITIKEIIDENNSCITRTSKNHLYKQVDYYIKREVSRVQEDYDAEVILVNKHEYLEKLVARYKDLRNGTLPLFVLKDFIDDFNNEYSLVNKSIKIIKK